MLQVQITSATCATIGDTRNKYVLVPLLWPASETLKQDKQKHQ